MNSARGETAAQVERWNIGTMECWLIRAELISDPAFHHSSIPLVVDAFTSVREMR